eukprot:15214570-Alexandrium_andersonii.AAC.1
MSECLHAVHSVNSSAPVLGPQYLHPHMSIPQPESLSRTPQPACLNLVLSRRARSPAWLPTAALLGVCGLQRLSAIVSD